MSLQVHHVLRTRPRTWRPVGALVGARGPERDGQAPALLAGGGISRPGAAGPGPSRPCPCTRPCWCTRRRPRPRRSGPLPLGAQHRPVRPGPGPPYRLVSAASSARPAETAPSGPTTWATRCAPEPARQTRAASRLLQPAEPCGPQSGASRGGTVHASRRSPGPAPPARRPTRTRARRRARPPRSPAPPRSPREDRRGPSHSHVSLSGPDTSTTPPWTSRIRSIRALSRAPSTARPVPSPIARTARDRRELAPPARAARRRSHRVPGSRRPDRLSSTVRDTCAAPRDRPCRRRRGRRRTHRPRPDHVPCDRAYAGEVTERGASHPRPRTPPGLTSSRCPSTAIRPPRLPLETPPSRRVERGRSPPPGRSQTTAPEDASSATMPCVLPVRPPP